MWSPMSTASWYWNWADHWVNRQESLGWNLPLLSLDILAGMQQPLGQGNAWTTFPFLAQEGAWHWVHLPLTSCGSLQYSGLWVEASPAFSRSMRIASGGTDWEVLSEEVTYRCGWEYSLRVSRLLQCSGCCTAFTLSSLASLGTA